MNMTKKLVITTTLLASIALAPIAAFAADDNLPSIRNGTVKITVDEVADGAVTLTSVPDFAAVVDTDNDEGTVIDFTVSGALEVIDTRAAGLGWGVEVIFTQPTIAASAEMLGATAINIGTILSHVSPGISGASSGDALGVAKTILSSTLKQSYSLSGTDITAGAVVSDVSALKGGVYTGIATYTLTPEVA
jgi:hypothetical protein